jgi:acylphosphatase
VTGSDHRVVEVVVHGQVQGVFFRDSCRTEAQRAGVAGWVRNEPDGTVRARFEGRAAAVDRLLAWVRHGPRHAHVDHVDEVDRTGEDDDTGAAGFSVR